MTIDEFKKNIAPYMKKGWIAMDKNLTFKFYKWKPKRNIKLGQWRSKYSYTILDRIFKIAPTNPLEDWTKSLIEVGGKND